MGAEFRRGRIVDHRLRVERTPFDLAALARERGIQEKRDKILQLRHLTSTTGSATVRVRKLVASQTIELLQGHHLSLGQSERIERGRCAF